MSFFTQLSAAKVFVAVGALVVVGVGVAALQPDDPTVVVTHIVDGDTIDVSIDGEDVRVRLLNVDTPESVDPSTAPECLGSEATALLVDLLPLGTEVSLEYDKERQDRYGRDLAGVFRDGVLVNAEIARAGLGTAVLFEPNDRFYDDVLEAEKEAQREGIGLFDPAIDCTLPSQVEAFEEVGESVIAGVPAASADLAALEQYGVELVTALAMGTALAEVLDGDRSQFPLLPHVGDLAELRRRTTAIRTSLETHIQENAAAVGVEEDRIAAQQAAAEEAERLAAEEAERLAAEEAARQAALEEAQREADKDEINDTSGGRDDSGDSERSDQGTGGGGGLPSDAGYTGCRDYSLQYPASAIDSKGRPFTKIDCTTKLPIG